MFTIKAEIQHPNRFHNTAQLYQAHSVRVRDTSDQPAASSTDPDVYVVLYDAAGDETNAIPVGDDYMQHYQRVYVMNEQGKTVETIRPSPIKPAMPAVTGRAFTRAG